MKPLSKFQLQSSSRNSPRSTSPSSPHVAARSEPETKTKTESQPDDSLALSLHVVEQAPLEMCYPSDEGSGSLRRSSRFTGNKYKTPSPKPTGPKSRPALSGSQLRWSRRRSYKPSSLALALTLIDGENVGPGEKRCLLPEGREAACRVRKKAKLDPSETVLRRSYRLKGVVHGKSSPPLLELPEPNSKYWKRCFLSEKGLRSRSILMHKVEKYSDGLNFKCLGSPLMKHASALSPEIKENMPLRSASSGKCLRSRTVKMPVGNEKEKGKSRSKKSNGDIVRNVNYLGSEKLEHALIKLPGSSRNLRRKSLGSCHKDSGGSLKHDMLVLPEKSTFSNTECSRLTRSLRRKLQKEMLETGGSIIELPENSSNPRNRSRSHKARDEISKGGMLLWLEKSEVSSEKRLESRSVEMEVQNESPEREGSVLNKKGLLSPKIESVLNELFGVTEEIDVDKCDLEVQSEKCERSVKVQYKVNTDKKYDKSTDGFEGTCSSKSKGKSKNAKESKNKEKSAVCGFVGKPIPEEEAQKKWQWRYELKNKKKGKGWKINADEEDEIILNVACHYAQAKVGNCVLDIGDCVYVKGEGTKKHIGRILEFFKTTLGDDYFRVQWFFRAQDTVLKSAASSHDKRRLFYSTVMNDNLLDCIISKVNVVQIQPTLSPNSKNIQSAAFYYDMEYCVEYSTFRTMVKDPTESQSLILSNSVCLDEKPITEMPLPVLPNLESTEPELALLDLYSGCGGMSTGLCLGAKLAGVNLVTKWAVDCNSSACDSLRLNHPETLVRNESVDCFLELLKHWKKLCDLYLSNFDGTLRCELEDPPEAEADTEESSGEYEVSYLVDICYGDPNKTGQCGLHFKVRWKRFGPDDDTWEPIEGLSNCRERIRDFIIQGFKSKILPLPGDVDVICGGPPCQGISGYNRFRNFESPLSDERNRQVIVFMDVVEFLRPRDVLMENVTDIIKFDRGSLGRYALGRLVHMHYQARLGTAASASYGLPQFRLRVFIWAAAPAEPLPPFPLPTHDVATVRYWPPLEFERNLVAHDAAGPRLLEPPALLRDSISDLPEVANDELLEEMPYENPPATEFQFYIRRTKDELDGSTGRTSGNQEVLYDHRPLRLSEHEYMRVCHVPRRKGANFRDFPGIVVGEDNVARREAGVGPAMLPDGKPLVPECVLNFEGGKSRKPYGRVWWDETVSTIVTFPHVRVQAILHPEQDRLLTVRECARLQGFPDYYRFCGTIKERYRQIGNAVSVPVARAMGYALGMAWRKAAGDCHVITLPPKFCCQVPACGEGFGG